MLRLSRIRWKWDFDKVFIFIALCAWNAVAFPTHLHLATTAFMFPLPSSSSANPIGWGVRRALATREVLEKENSIVGEVTESSCSQYDEAILKFLDAKSRESPSSLLEQFHVHGWRWHTKSLARDAGRLQKLALKTNLNSVGILKDASDFVVGFNMMGLQKVESSLFFPWMREKLTEGFRKRPELSKDFNNVLDELETDRLTVARLGESISNQVLLACDEKAPEAHRSNAIMDIANQAADLQNLVQRMISIEDTYLVPAIGATVPVREQKSFSNKVLRKLGILDSRLHIVGMFDAICEDSDGKEMKLFQQEIPGITRKIIPRWKRKLYEPKTYMME